MRIAKYIANCNYCSRRRAEELIAQGLVKVNHELVVHPSHLVSAGDKIEVSGKELTLPPHPEIWLYHKPIGVLTTTYDQLGRRDVFSEVPKDLSNYKAVGRLDCNTSGLLLLTNNSAVARFLELPVNNIPRTYIVKVYGILPTNFAQTLHNGIEVGGIRYERILMRELSSTKLNHTLELELVEGKNREIRRIMEYFELKIKNLVRIKFGLFQLDDLEIGQVIIAPDALIQHYFLQSQNFENDTKIKGENLQIQRP